jgi:hypothetical protein
VKGYFARNGIVNISSKLATLLSKKKKIQNVNKIINDSTAKKKLSNNAISAKIITNHTIDCN